MRAFHRVLVVLFGLWGTCVSAAPYDEELGKTAEAIQAAVAQQELRSVAVADFSDLQGQGSDIGRLLADELTSKLVSLGGGIVVMDRSTLMHELRKRGGTMEDLNDPEKLRAIASHLKLGAVAKGTVIPMGSRLRLKVNLISAQSATIIASVASEIPLTESLASFSNEGATETGEPLTNAKIVSADRAKVHGFKPKSVENERFGKLEFVRLEDEGEFSVTTLKFTASGQFGGRNQLYMALQQPAQNTYLVDSEGNQFYAVGARRIGVVDKEEGSMRHDTKKGELHEKLFATNVPTMFQIVTPRFPPQSDEVSIVVILAIGGDMHGGMIRWYGPATFSIRTEKLEAPE